MATFHAARPMEDFFINPTFRHPHATMVDDNQLYTTARAGHDEEYTVASTGKSPPKASASIVDLVNEPMFWHGYTSEEEVASPVDDDDDDDDGDDGDGDDDEFSLHSDESIDSIASNASFPELLAEACSNVKQQCSRAQAVRIQAAGKARVVSLRKSIDIPARRSPMKPATPGTSSPRRATLARLQSTSGIESSRNSQDSRTSRNDSLSSSVNSPASTAPSSVDEPLDQRPPIKHQKSFSRHVPLMEAAKAFSLDLPISPISPSYATHLTRHSIALSDRSDVTASSSVRRMTKFSLNKIGKNLVGRESAELESAKESQPNYVFPAQRHRVPARSTSLKSKMVARAANERAPPIILPPFPDDGEDDWPLRKDVGARPRPVSRRLTHVALVS